MSTIPICQCNLNYHLKIKRFFLRRGVLLAWAWFLCSNTTISYFIQFPFHVKKSMQNSQIEWIQWILPIYKYNFRGNNFFFLFIFILMLYFVLIAKYWFVVEVKNYAFFLSIFVIAADYFAIEIFTVLFRREKIYLNIQLVNENVSKAFKIPFIFMIFLLTTQISVVEFSCQKQLKKMKW